MHLQITRPKWSIITLVAFEGLFWVWMSFWMSNQVASFRWWKLALVTFKRFFSSHIFPQITLWNKCKFTLITFLWPFSSVFSSDFAIEIHEGLHNHIVYIGKIFRRCEFSNVSLDALPERKKSHIGCICAVFLRSEFLNALSKQLPKQRQSRIARICMIFLPNEPWHVSSNRLAGQLQSHNDGICLSFLSSGF